MSRFVLHTTVMIASAVPAFAQFQHPSPLPDVLLVNDSFGVSSPTQSSYDWFEDQIIRLADFDGDGNYEGQLETNLLFEFGKSPNKNKSWQILRVRTRIEDGVPAVYFTNGRNGNMGTSNNFVAQLYRGVDLDGSGFIDPHEATLVMDLEQVLGGKQGAEDVALTKNGGLWATTEYPGGGLVYLGDGAPVATIDFNSFPTFKVPGKNNAQVSIDSDDLTTCTSYLDNGVLVYADGFGSVKDEAIHSFRDLNGDGDAKDPGEATCFLNASGANPGLVKNPDFGTVLPSVTINAASKSYVWLKEMATMDEIEHESYFFASSSSNSGSFSVNEHGRPVNGLIFRAVDLDGDHDVNDSGEVNLYYDGSALAGPGLEFQKILGIDVYQQSVIVFYLDGGSKGVSILTDLDGNGDAMGPGERLDVWNENGAASLPYNLFLFGTAAAALEPGLIAEPQSRQATYIGSGCSQFGGPVPHLFAQGDFRPGSSYFDVRLTGAAPNAPAIFCMGVTTKFMGQNIPVPLDFLGLPGCRLYQDLTYQWPTYTDINGEVRISFGNLLDVEDLSNLTYLTQFITSDTSAVVPELAFSRQMILKAP